MYSYLLEQFRKMFSKNQINLRNMAHLDLVWILFIQKICLPSCTAQKLKLPTKLQLGKILIKRLQDIACSLTFSGEKMSFFQGYCKDDQNGLIHQENG